eukprot:Rmarinus@m.21138
MHMNLSERMDVRSRKSEPSQVIDAKIKEAKDRIDELFETLIADVEVELKGVDMAPEKPKGKAKEFKARDSLLIRLLRLREFQTMYNIFIAVLIWLFLSIVSQNYDERGIFIDFNLFFWCFGDFHVVVTTWFWLFGGAFIIIPITRALTFPNEHNADEPSSHSHAGKRLFFLAVYVTSQCAMCIGATSVCIVYALPPASAAVVMCEQVRMSMKMHAYLMENLGQGQSLQGDDVDASKQKSRRRGGGVKRGSARKVAAPTSSPKMGARSAVSAGGQADCDDMSVSGNEDVHQFAYFMFAPTLLFRTSYPHTDQIRWSYVFSRLAETAGCIVYTFVIFQRFVLVDGLKNFGLNPHHDRTIVHFIRMTFECMVPACLTFMLGFFLVLHSWQNVMAELTQFADREFYEDWWNSSGFSEYYRKWNLIVHEWLWQYVYQAARFTPAGDRRTLSTTSLKMIVFFVSALVHEYIIAVVLQCVYPILAVLFVVAMAPLIWTSRALALTFGNRMGNLFIWLNFLLGNGMLLVLFAWEWYYRQNHHVEPSWSAWYPLSVGYLLGVYDTPPTLPAVE